VQLVLNGDEHQKARIILAHAGGFLPYISHRVAELARIFRPDVQDPDHILAGLRRFYFDTALSSSSVALPSLDLTCHADHAALGRGVGTHVANSE
jgi:hypothetical protein